MSLTSSMKSFTDEVAGDSKRRTESVASMIAQFKKDRADENRNSRKQRSQFIATLKTDVRNLLASQRDARNAMGQETRRSLYEFMQDLRDSTTRLLGVYEKDRMLLAADVSGARAEWAGLEKKKVEARGTRQTLTASAAAVRPQIQRTSSQTSNVVVRSGSLSSEVSVVPAKKVSVVAQKTVKAVEKTPKKK